MKRVLSLVLALVLVLGSMPLAFADDHMTAGDMLYDWGLIEGYSATEKQLGEEDTLTRAQMMKLLAEVMGEEEQAAAYPGSFFTDLVEGDTLNSYVNYAASKGWTTGVGDMMFNPAGEVSQEMAATFMMRALGYEPVWGQATAAVAALGIVVPVNNAGELTRGEVFQYMVASLNTDTTDGVKLGAKLGVEGFEAEEPVVEAEELEVVSVDATNLIEVIVEFNQDVTDNEEVADKENYEVDLEDIDKVTVDGNVVVIKLDAGVDNQEDAVLTVSDEILAEEEEFEFTFFDAELPEVLGLTVTGPKTFEIEFSEPIETGGNVTVKSGSSTLSVNKAQITGVGSTTMTVPMFSTMKDDTTYTVTVKEFADYAGYNNIVKSLEFTYVKDVTPPEATIVEATQEYVLVKFSKPVKGLTPNHFSHTFSAWKSLKITEDDEFTSTAVTHTDAVSEVYVWFYGDDSNNERPIPAGENEFKILSKADDSSDNSRTIKDNWDNEFATTTIAFSVTADLTAPEVKEIKVDSEDTLTIEFTKNVVFDEDNVEVLLDDGSEIDDLDLSVTDLTDYKKFEISLGADTDLSGETIVITISDVEDKTLNANVMPDYSETIEITDKTDPVVNDVTYEVEDETGFIYVFFNEDMDSDTTLVSGNYFLYDGTTYRKLSEEIEFSNGNKVVKIELTSTQKEYVDGAAYGKLLVTNVEDLNGNEIVPSLTTIVDHSTYSPAIDTVEATAVDTIEVTFTQELGDVDMDGFRQIGRAHV